MHFLVPAMEGDEGLFQSPESVAQPQIHILGRKWPSTTCQRRARQQPLDWASVKLSPLPQISSNPTPVDHRLASGTLLGRLAVSTFGAK